MAQLHECEHCMCPTENAPDDAGRYGVETYICSRCQGSCDREAEAEAAREAEAEAEAERMGLTPIDGCVLAPAALYYADGGAIYHGACCGRTAQLTGRDLSGQRLCWVSDEDKAEWIEEIGVAMTCEACNEPERDDA